MNLKNLANLSKKTKKVVLVHNGRFAGLLGDPDLLEHNKRVLKNRRLGKL